MSGHGLIVEEPVPEKDFVLGGFGSMDGPILVKDGQWDRWLPDVEVQKPGNFEPNACVPFTILNCAETLERHEYGIAHNYSDRFLAKASNTDPHKGNTPNKVAEALRLQGCVKEHEWPYTEQGFYDSIPEQIRSLAHIFTAAYNLGHEFVPQNANSLMTALTYSPLLFSVNAWQRDDQGLYYRPQGLSDNHAVMLYGYEEGKYWKVFDTYADSKNSVLKRVRWDCLPMVAKRFTLHRQIVSESAFRRFIKFLRQALGL